MEENSDGEALVEILGNDIRLAHFAEPSESGNEAVRLMKFFLNGPEPVKMLPIFNQVQGATSGIIMGKT